MRRSFVGWALLLAGMLTGPGAPSGARAAEVKPALASQVSVPVQEHTLSNGLRVLLAPDPTTPRVSLHLAVANGAAQDPAGGRGMAEVIGHLLTDPSTRHVPGSIRNNLFRALGVDPWSAKVDAGLDATAITLTVPPSEVALALWMESDRFGFLLDGVDDEALRKASAAVERPPIPFAAALRLGRAALYGAEHAYAGLGAVPAPIDLSAVHAHYRKHFVPRNTILALAGNLDARAVKAQIEETFGSLLDLPRPEAPAAPNSALDREKRLRIEAKVLRPEVMILWPTATYLEPDDLLLDGVARALQKRLDKRLVDAKLATITTAWQWSGRLASTFQVSASVADGHTVDEVEKAMNEELDRLRREPPSAAEAARASRILLSSHLEQLTEPGPRAERLATLLRVKNNALDLPQFLAGYEAVDAASIHRAVQKYMPADRRVVVTVSASPSAPAEGRLLEGGAR